MPQAIKAMLALTRHATAAPSAKDLCTACLPADIRDELASLSHAQDVDELASPPPRLRVVEKT